MAQEEIFLSVVAIGELRKGIELIKRLDPGAAGALDGWLTEILAEASDRILPVDLAVAEQWGRLDVPDPRPVTDSFQAATALAHGLTLVTRNVKDVAGARVAVIKPFEGSVGGP